MRRPALALVVPLVTLLALTGCGSDDDGDGSDDAGDGGTSPVALEDIDPCGALTPETVEQLVGEPVTRDDAEAGGLPTCAFVGQGDDDAGSIVQVLALPMGGRGGFADFDEVIDTQRTGEEEPEVSDVDLPDTDEAALVDDDQYGLASTTLLAVADGVAYTVYPSGVTREDEVRVATGALTVLLGGDLPADASIQPATDDVCSLLSERDLAEVVGTRVQARASTVGDSPTCGWSGDDVSVSVLDSGSTTRIEAIAGLGGEDDASTTSQVDVADGALAYLKETEYGASGFVAVRHHLYSVDVSLYDEGEGEAEAISEVLVLLAEPA